ncbi:acyl carrier protein 2, mitochondrial [Cinnamomum micranthum f. kanehirae]|uniref:Acyl carrier protein n=1 Tax=Cinnamomum micranthum f. kanehirae TaxID=337451 RepID=A0A3S3PAM3_9MAGN|nr:acyl carrier protein 2, mitochondrial [Cinnamomum micranthum f. kanehirae]
MSQNYFQITRSYFRKYFLLLRRPFFKILRNLGTFLKYIESSASSTNYIVIVAVVGSFSFGKSDSRGRKKMQGAGRAVIRRLRSSPSLSFPSSTIRSPSNLGFLSGSRVFSQSAAAAAAAPSLDKEEATSRVLSLLKSIHFIDPSKVNPTASFKDDLQLDTLDNVEVMMAVEEEFVVDIPNSEADKISTTAHLIDYISAHPQAK